MSGGFVLTLIVDAAAGYLMLGVAEIKTFWWVIFTCSLAVGLTVARYTTNIHIGDDYMGDGYGGSTRKVYLFGDAALAAWEFAVVSIIALIVGV